MAKWYPLDTPLDRVENLPTSMNWRGNWMPNEQYYIYDLAISASNSAAYILFGATTDRGIVDPANNPLWFEIHPHNTAIQSLTAGNGIGFLPPVQNPTIVNTGIITINGTNGISVVNGPTPQSRVVTNTGILSLTNGSGIGLPAPDTLTNLGVLATSRFGIGNTGSPTNQVLTNLGILSATAGAGISVVGNTIANTGILLVQAGQYIQKTGFGVTPILSCYPPSARTTSLSIVTPITSPYVIPPNGSIQIPFTLDPNSLLQHQLTYNSTDPNPYWLFDLTGIRIEFGVDTIITITVGLSNGTNIVAGNNAGYTQATKSSFSTGPDNGFASAGFIFLPLSALRPTLTTITSLYIGNPRPPSNTNLTVICGGEILAHYFPNAVI